MTNDEPLANAKVEMCHGFCPLSLRVPPLGLIRVGIFKWRPLKPEERPEMKFPGYKQRRINPA
ncbi:MAG: hypothetical protein ACE5H9_20320 [Anaerolineae bacterium]